MTQPALPHTITLGGRRAAYVARLLRELEPFLVPSTHTGTTPPARRFRAP
jgi:hypothetical protein